MTLVLSNTNVVWILKLRGYLVGHFICLHCELDHLVDNSLTWVIVHLNFRFFFKPLIFSLFFHFFVLIQFLNFLFELHNSLPVEGLTLSLLFFWIDLGLFGHWISIQIQLKSFNGQNVLFFQKIVDFFIFTIFIWTKNQLSFHHHQFNLSSKDWVSISIEKTARKDRMKLCYLWNIIEWVVSHHNRSIVKTICAI